MFVVCLLVFAFSAIFSFISFVRWLFVLLVFSEPSETSLMAACNLESACNAGNAGVASSIPEWGSSPGGRNGNSLQFLPGESQEQRTLVGYSPKGHKELDMTEYKHAINGSAIDF